MAETKRRAVAEVDQVREESRTLLQEVQAQLTRAARGHGPGKEATREQRRFRHVPSIDKPGKGSDSSRGRTPRAAKGRPRRAGESPAADDAEAAGTATKAHGPPCSLRDTPTEHNKGHGEGAHAGSQALAFPTGPPAGPSEGGSPKAGRSQAHNATRGASPRGPTNPTGDPAGANGSTTQWRATNPARQECRKGPPSDETGGKPSTGPTHSDSLTARGSGDTHAESSASRRDAQPQGSQDTPPKECHKGATTA